MLAMLDGQTKIAGDLESDVVTRSLKLMTTESENEELKAWVRQSRPN